MIASNDEEVFPATIASFISANNFKLSSDIKTKTRYSVSAHSQKLLDGS